MHEVRSRIVRDPVPLRDRRHDDGVIAAEAQRRQQQQRRACRCDRQFNMRPISPTAAPITGPASQVPNAGPARKPMKDALPSNTKRRLRSTVVLQSAM